MGCRRRIAEGYEALGVTTQTSDTYCFLPKQEEGHRILRRVEEGMTKTIPLLQAQQTTINVYRGITIREF